MADKGQNKNTHISKQTQISAANSDFVFEKTIFNNVFERDIRRIYIYRKSERLAKALQLIAPGLSSAPSLRNKLDSIAVGLIEAATLSTSATKDPLSKELLALSSLLSVARIGGMISEMNADLITQEALELLHETASYEQPHLTLEESPTIAELLRRAPHATESHSPVRLRQPIAPATSGEIERKGQYKGQSVAAIKDNDSAPKVSARTESIMRVLSSKGPSYIKDISVVMRDISEKTIQRELQTLVAQGKVERVGERRWTRYSLP